MTCKDCLHYNVCHYHIDEETPFAVTECNNFKNKADFFEIVRCENCKHGEKFIISRSKDGVEEDAVLCGVKSRFKACDEWCGCGERKDT